MLTPRYEKKGRLIVFFDDECGLCNGTVTFLLERDRGEVLTFAPLSGRAAAPFCGHEPESIIVVDGFPADHPEVLRKSDAVFRALDAIGGPWRLLSLLKIVPRAIRDLVYGIIARNRYRWFGKTECRLITPELRARFLD